jgi:hypothetical protein
LNGFEDEIEGGLLTPGKKCTNLAGSKVRRFGRDENAPAVGG